VSLNLAAYNSNKSKRDTLRQIYLELPLENNNNFKKAKEIKAQLKFDLRIIKKRGTTNFVTN
jgi:hypothetical protein